MEQVKHVRGKKRAGLLYEKAVLEALEERFGPLFSPKPWLAFRRPIGEWHWCQPDGLLFDPQAGLLTIVEVKYTHTPRAYFQLWEMYKPVLERLFPVTLWRYRLIEICKKYTVIPFPGPFRIMTELNDEIGNETGVYVWTP